ncbi:MAG: TetR family transcriptional regulator [Micavibrio aeruginosavorus]|uniref:TetR family transcriptional regulator n=1 Tax=Micavibrio aeruginosavorus TaxID=349221 RepID=A0A2W5FLM5_9BACT|nr:MAG: TetR family transcriptional regulator [Micavibrio aeruginosavorus]
MIPRFIRHRDKALQPRKNILVYKHTRMYVCGQEVMFQVARKTKEEAKETREAIINAAIDVFYEHGVSKGSLEEIAEAAGVTRGAVYWHFKNKAAIFSAIHDEFHTSVMEGFITQADNSIDPVHDLKEFSGNFLKLLQEDERHKKILSLFSLKCDYSGEMAEFLDEQRLKKMESMKQLEKFFALAQKKGQIEKDRTTELLAVSFFCYMCGISTESLRHPTIVSLTKNGPELIDMFFKKL